MEPTTPRMEVFESRLLFLEKRDKEKNSEILELKEENLSLKKEVFHLKKVVKKGKRLDSNDSKGEAAMLGLEHDLTDRLDQLQNEVTKSNEKIWKELGKVESIQKVFNRMLVNGHRNDLEEKVSRLERKLAMVKTEKSKVQKQELEEKMMSLMRAKLSDWTGFQLSVDPQIGEKISVDVDPTYTVARLKSLIQAKLGVKPCFQVLTFGTTSLTDDEETLDDLGVDDDSEIGLTVRDMQVLIVLGTGKKITIDVKPTHTIAMLKSLIKAKTGISPCYQFLTFGDSRLIDDEKTLENLQVDDRSEIVLTEKESAWDVFVKTEDGQGTNVDVDFRTDVLTTIHMSHHQLGIPLDSHKALVFNDQVLDEKKLLVEYGIKRDCVLTLVVDALKAKSREQAMTILVDGRNLDVYPSTSILQVRCLLHPYSKPESRPPGGLVFKEKTLTYNKKLSDYGITNLSHIIDRTTSAEDSPRNTTVKVTVTKYSDQNSKYVVWMDYWNSLKDLKGLIQDQWAIPGHRQTLVLKGISCSLHLYYSRDEYNTDFNPGISFSDITNLTDVVLDPRVTPVILPDAKQRIVYKYSLNRINIQSKDVQSVINPTFSLPSYQNQANRTYVNSHYKDRKDNIEILGIDFILL